MVEAERDVLNDRLKKTLHEKMSTNDLSNMQKERLTQLEKKISNLELNEEKIVKVNE